MSPVWCKQPIDTTESKHSSRKGSDRTDAFTDAAGGPGKLCSHEHRRGGSEGDIGADKRAGVPHENLAQSPEAQAHLENIRAGRLSPRDVFGEIRVIRGVGTVERSQRLGRDLPDAKLLGEDRAAELVLIPRVAAVECGACPIHRNLFRLGRSISAAVHGGQARLPGRPRATIAAALTRLLARLRARAP